MNLAEETDALRRKLAALAAEPDEALTGRYRLRGSAAPRTAYWQFRRFASAALRTLGRLRFGRSYAWPARLKHMPGSPGARPLLIWAVDMDRDTLRAACRGLASISAPLPDFAPVLVTNVADFAFFARLGWLVEFLPVLDGEGEPFDIRKARLIARLYRGAPVLPAAAGLVAADRMDEIVRLSRRA